MFFWSLGTFRIWLIARHRLLLNNYPDIPTGNRALLEVARAMVEGLGEAAEAFETPGRLEISTLTNKAIEKELDRVGGGTIRFPGAGEAGFVREEQAALPDDLLWLDASMMLWFAAALAIAAGQSGRLSEYVSVWLVTTFGGAALAAVLARMLGSTRRWRVVVAILLWVLFFLIGAVVIVKKAYKTRT